MSIVKMLNDDKVYRGLALVFTALVAFVFFHGETIPGLVAIGIVSLLCAGAITSTLKEVRDCSWAFAYCAFALCVVVLTSLVAFYKVLCML